jgi:predicted nucleotidyltransferase
MKKLEKEEVLRIVRELHAKLDVIYGDRLKGVYLYGSYARGDAREDSDIDVAIVLYKPERRNQETHRTIDIFSEVCLREECMITPFFLSVEEYSEKPYGIFRSIAHEGILV